MAEARSNMDEIGSKLAELEQEIIDLTGEEDKLQGFLKMEKKMTAIQVNVLISVL